MKEISHAFVCLKIKEARLSKGLTQQELAQSIGKQSSTYIALIEAGKRKVDIEDLGKIAKVLHRDIDFFFGSEKGTPSLSFALRSEGLNEENIKQADKFIEFIRNQQGNGNNSQS